MCNTESWRTQDGRGVTAVALASRFWGLGCPKIFHEVATRLAGLGKGVGSALLQAIEAEALRLGLAQLSVEASITARGFFERKGFVVGSAQRVTRRGEDFLNYLMFKNIVN
ncbi:MAG: GNAT family N-acetyltransferase [Candidatus Thiodiazotropha sp. (ex Gloverina cf. vestifex)]|nr:GNAT family N-acetyltransferase [Candidatus Thiodiazotropha sp. (ex Gloverina cf. vestifex)]